MRIRSQELILQFHEIRLSLELILNLPHPKYHKQASKIKGLILQVLVMHFYLLEIKLRFLLP